MRGGHYERILDRLNMWRRWLYLRRDHYLFPQTREDSGQLYAGEDERAAAGNREAGRGDRTPHRTGPRMEQTDEIAFLKADNEDMAEFPAEIEQPKFGRREPLPCPRADK